MKVGTKLSSLSNHSCIPYHRDYYCEGMEVLAIKGDR